MDYLITQLVSCESVNIEMTVNYIQYFSVNVLDFIFVVTNLKIVLDIPAPYRFLSFLLL